MRCLVAVLACFALPGLSEAQVSSGRNDAAVFVGQAGTQNRVVDDYGWNSGLLAGATVGHYWSDHLKTDVDLVWQSSASSTSYQEFVIDGAHVWGESRYRIRDLRLGIGQVYQFGRNVWVHPYLGGGIDVVWSNASLQRPAQTGFADNRSTPQPKSLSIPELTSRETDVLVRPFLKGGAKLYASDRVFFLTELKFGFSSGIEHAAWKAGIGFDF